MKGVEKFLDLTPSIRRRYAASVWIPLRLFETVKAGEYNRVGYEEAFDGAHSILVYADKRKYGEDFSWSSYDEARHWAEKDFYKASDVYAHNQHIDVGIRLVLRQSVAGSEKPVWHLHQDVVLALSLVREGDSWVRPEEGYVEVVRLRRNSDGSPVAIEMRSEHLRDYMSARGASLRIACYRSRTVVTDNLSGIDYKLGSETTEIEGGRLEKLAIAIDSTGAPHGSSVAVFRVSRTDVDEGDDVPVMGPETASNTDSESWTFTRGGAKAWRVSEEFWRDEWIEPSSASIRVRRDRVASAVSFITDADGTRMSADDLNDEDIGRWLWFQPGVIAGLAARRGGHLSWYTRDTGGIETPGEPSVHFGINESGLVTVYAFDVARLEEWERRFWSGFNVTPEGKVSAELLSSQVHTKPADTLPPEKYIVRGLDTLGKYWHDRFGTTIFRPHDDAQLIRSRLHRSRSLDDAGFLALAKDVARLTADSIDIASAQKVAAPPSGRKWGSLKSFEAALATLADEKVARQITGPLFGAYDLRMSDAHLPRSDRATEMKLVGVHESDLPIEAGRKLLSSVTDALYAAARLLNREVAKPTPRRQGSPGLPT